jgi:hypothetical protein
MMESSLYRWIIALGVVASAAGLSGCTSAHASSPTRARPSSHPSTRASTPPIVALANVSGLVGERPIFILHPLPNNFMRSGQVPAGESATINYACLGTGSMTLQLGSSTSTTTPCNNQAQVTQMPRSTTSQVVMVSLSGVVQKWRVEGFRGGPSQPGS